MWMQLQAFREWGGAGVKRECVHPSCSSISRGKVEPTGATVLDSKTICMYICVHVSVCSPGGSDAHRSVYSPAVKWWAQLRRSSQQAVLGPLPDGHSRLHRISCRLPHHRAFPCCCHFLCPHPRGHFRIARSVCLSVPWCSCLGCRHAGCLQLSNRLPPKMCRLRTRPRTDINLLRFLDWTAVGGVLPLSVRYLVLFVGKFIYRQVAAVLTAKGCIAAAT